MRTACRSLAGQSRQKRIERAVSPPDARPYDADPCLVLAADVDEVRDGGTALIAALVRHRQRGSDLMYEGYTVDIGGQD